MGAMAQQLRDAGHLTMSLWVAEDNIPARRFYAALGGQIVARRNAKRASWFIAEVAYGWTDLARLLPGR